MAKQRNCPPCGTILTADSDDELVAAVRAHALEHHGVELDPAHILEEAVEV